MLKLFSKLTTWIQIALIVLVLIAFNAAGALIPGVPDNWLWAFVARTFRNILEAVLSQIWPYLLLTGIAGIAYWVLQDEDRRDTVQLIIMDNSKASMIAAGLIVAIVLLGIFGGPLLAFLGRLPWGWIAVFGLPALVVIGVIIADRAGWINL